MKEWLIALFALSLFDRRKHREEVFTERRRITAKQAQKMLTGAIDRLNKAVDKERL